MRGKSKFIFRGTVRAVTSFVEVVDDDIVWRFDTAFFTSSWQCIWGRGCQGILDRLAPELNQGCCSEGAALVDDDDAMNVMANAAALTAEQWQHATDTPLERRGADGRWFTKVVDNACVFFNRPGFAGGDGCALHIGADAFDERPLDWKPNVCWQMPMRVETDGAVRTVRPWARRDWGPDAELAWFCTEPGSGAFGGPGRVVETLRNEIIEMAGEAVYERLLERLI
jgi:hypothetical protein